MKGRKAERQMGRKTYDCMSKQTNRRMDRRRETYIHNIHMSALTKGHTDRKADKTY
jgi:hypothetical protein